VTIGWDVSHLEFIISDYYYFGKLNKFLADEGFTVQEVEAYDDLRYFDTIVFNYPELSFSESEVNQIFTWLEEGKTIIFAGYYKNEDGVGENINRVIERFGMRMNLEEPMDFTSDDPYYVHVTTRTGLKGIFPCTDTVSGGEPILFSSVGDVGTQVKVGKGKIITLGSCVFWDSFSLALGDNAHITKLILSGLEL
jgi:hypothetical protein